MGQTSAGALKIAAKKAGLSIEEFQRLISDGFKKCTKCKEWMPRGQFAKDASRHDLASSKCFECTHVQVRKTTNGKPSTFRGRTHTEESKTKMSASKKGRPSKFKGIPRSIETKRKISRTLRVTAVRGSEAPGYIDGKGAERRDFRVSIEIKRWAYDVKLRDEFTCVLCGDNRGGNLHSHHIRSFAEHPELRTDVRNGVTLCRTCHITVHQYGLELWTPFQ